MSDAANDTPFASPDLLLSAIVDSSDAAIVSEDLDGIIRSWNNGAERIFGYTAAEMVGRPITTIIPPDRTDEEPEFLKRLSRAECVTHYETVRLRKNGERVDLSVTVSPIKDAAGQILGAWKIARDVSEQKRAHRTLELAYDELTRWERSEVDFLATLSQELRSPLNTILNWVQLLREEPNDEAETAEGLAVIEQSVRTETELIEDLLDISRIESSRVNLDLKNLDIRAVLDAAIASVRPAADAKEAQFECEFAEIAGVVAGDKGRLHQVVRNLLVNAVKVSPTGGCIKIAINEKDSHVEIAVSDSGPGITSDLLPRIFERFQLGPIAQRRPGLGFGLYVARQLTRMHGGELSAHNCGEGEGATLILSLPLIQAPPGEDLSSADEEPNKIEPSEVKARLDGIKVLVVDDKREAVDVLKRILETRQATVETASSMNDALELVPDFLPDIVLADIVMPDHDGYELVRRLHCMSGVPFIPAVALTALARPEDRARALRAGFQLHIAKPVDTEELIAAVLNLTAFPRS